VIHEAAHGITIGLGWKYKFSIWPFPSMRLGRFTFACVTYEPTSESKPVSDFGWALVAIMPKVVNVVLVCLSQVCVVFVSPHIALPILLVPWFNLVDFSTAVISIFKTQNKSDTWEFQRLTGVSVVGLRIVVLGILVLLAIWNTWTTICVIAHL
jgi:hypothetical protein